MSTIVESLTKDIVNRDLQAEGAALLNKWEKTGLLEGLDNDRTKNSMARLLENQAKQLLKEASSMSAGDVEGFAAVAFPIVRRVFGGLIANELVSVQPMSLPSGLIFFLDFTYTDNRLPGAAAGDNAFTAGDSVYGGGKVGKGIQTGVTLSGEDAEKGPYALNNAYSQATGTFAAAGASPTTNGLGTPTLKAAVEASDAAMKRIRYDVDLLSDLDTASSTIVEFVSTNAATTELADLNLDNLISINAANANTGGAIDGKVIRRLTEIDADGKLSVILFRSGGTVTDPTIALSGTYSRIDNADATAGVPGALTLDLFEEGAGDGTSFTNTGLAGMNQSIAEIDIKVDSVAVTANTRKLKAKWSPELAQDLNAYHNLDAEVELTSILSEQVALEIDREILNDLIQGATAGTKYWSRRPGKFVNRDTGAQVGATTAAPDFTGTVSEWYETLAETINDVSANIHRKTLRGGANFVVCSPEVANLLEFTAGFRATVNHEEMKGGQIGAVKVGAMSKKFDVYVDPYFPRNVILVGRRGNSFLESGYVYSPYVPLQVTPTIFGVEDFVPRKGVMTRYAKKMVRPDMYGLVVCQDLIG